MHRRNVYCGTLMLMVLLSASVGAAARQKGDAPKKIRVAVFAKTGSEYKWAQDLTSSAIEDKLSENGFSLVARKDLDTVLGELELTVNSLFDSKEGAKLGKQAGARFLVLGKVQDIHEKSKFGPLAVPGSPSTLEVSIQMQVVNCETSDIVFTKTYTEKSKNKSVYNAKEESGKRNGAFVQAMGVVLDKFVADTRELTQSGPLAQSGSDDKVATALGESPGDTGNKPKPGGPAKPATAKPATEPATATTSSVIHAKIVDVDGKTVFLEISGARVGQVFEVYAKRRPVTNEKGELLSYYYSSSDKCAVVRVTEALSSNSVVATVEQTFGPAGAADPKPRPDRITRLYVARSVN